MFEVGGNMRNNAFQVAAICCSYYMYFTFTDSSTVPVFLVLEKIAISIVFLRKLKVDIFYIAE